jgi:hypothetical protein
LVVKQQQLNHTSLGLSLLYVHLTPAQKSPNVAMF